MSQSDYAPLTFGLVLFKGGILRTNDVLGGIAHLGHTIVETWEPAFSIVRPPSLSVLRIIRWRGHI